MIYITNFCSFLINIINNTDSGIYLPQNLKYIKTSQMAAWIAESRGKPLYMSSFLGLLVSIFIRFLPIVKKSFGSLAYEHSNANEEAYCIFQEEESIKECVRI